MRAPVELDLSRGWQVECPSAEPPAGLAAAELERALSAITGRRPGGGVRLTLGHGARGGEGFRWRAVRDGVELWGEDPRGLLWAAYSLLEALGCRWAWPGDRGEVLPQGKRFLLPAAPVEEAPALPGRCLVLGHEAFLREAEEWVEWAGRNRLNTLFVHVSTAPGPVGAAPEALWCERRERVVRLLRERGIALEHGGHLLPELLPPELHRRLPGEGTAERPGAASAELQRAVREHAHEHPEVRVFHLWGADLPAGAGGRTTSVRALRVANAAAEALESVRPDAQLAFLAYHETEEVPSGIRPRPNVCLLWTPRERCYAHGADDPACPRNARYRDTFRAQVEHFRDSGAAPARVFEYYLDAILFSQGVPPLGHVMARDLAFYRDAGAHTVQALMTGRGGWREPHPNAWLFARLAWDPSRDPDELVREFAEVVFGEAAAQAQAKRYRAVEEQTRPALARCRR